MNGGDGGPVPGGGLHVVVDAANVVGSRPDGWWRDRPGAARRFTGQLVATLTENSPALTAALGRPAGTPLTVHLVLEGAAARVPDLPTHPRLIVVHAPADGDGAIVEVVAELAGADRDAGADVVVVTADRGLQERVRTAGADVAGPGTLLGVLPPTS